MSLLEKFFGSSISASDEEKKGTVLRQVDMSIVNSLFIILRKMEVNFYSENLAEVKNNLKIY
jgi:hypothetical protein